MKQTNNQTKRSDVECYLASLDYYSRLFISILFIVLKSEDSVW